MSINGSNSKKPHTPYLLRYQLISENNERAFDAGYELKAHHSFASSSAKAVDVKYFQCLVAGRISYSVLMRADSWHDLQTHFHRDVNNPYTDFLEPSSQWGNYSMLHWQFQRAEFNFSIPAANDSSPAGQAKVSLSANLQLAPNVLAAKSADFTIKLHNVLDVVWGARFSWWCKIRKCIHIYDPKLALFECAYFHQSGHVPFRVQALPFNGFV